MLVLQEEFGRLVVTHGNCIGMKPPSDHQQNSLKSIDQGLIKTVMQTYADCKANGLGEMAARNAAIMVLREALPTWNFRAASDMVSRIIALSSPAGQTA
ncbi:MAG: hypothetical protein OEU92_11155 [Alphaproteobacteria bacterium]|nr:hypothetical protein [Alphaproteobacteria bacterium]